MSDIESGLASLFEAYLVAGKRGEAERLLELASSELQERLRERLQREEPPSPLLEAAELSSKLPDAADKQLQWVLSRLQSGEVLFQLACGAGAFANRLSAKGWHVSASDYREDALQIARQVSTQKGLGSLFYMENSIGENLHGKYDVILYLRDIPGLPPPLVLQEAFMLTKIGGRFLVSFPCATGSVWPYVNYLENAGWYVQEASVLRSHPYIMLEAYRDIPFVAEGKQLTMVFVRERLSKDDWRIAVHHVLTGHKVTVYTPAKQQEESVVRGIRFLDTCHCQDILCDVLYGERPETVVATVVLP